MKGEGHYTVKRVKKLPKKGNANWLYILKTDPVDKFYIWLLNGSYQEIKIGTSSNINIYSSDGNIPANTIRQVHLQNDLSSFQLDVLGTPNLFTFGRDESTYVSPSIYISSTDETNIIELGDALPMQITANSGRISTVVGTDVTTVTTSAEIKTSNNSAALYVDINSAEAGMRGGFLTMKGQIGANYLGEVGVNISGIDILSANSIRLQTGDGTNTIPSVVGEVWTATGVFGEGHWAPPQGAGFQRIPLTVNNLFNYLPFEISSFNDENFYSKNLDLLSNFKVNTVMGAGITYVDAINGLDTNNGAQISRPKKTIAAALALGASIILLKNGYYDKFDWRFDSPLSNRSRVIIGIGDNVVFGVKGDVLQSFSTSPFGTATLQMTLLTNDNLLVLTRKDQLDNDGQPTPIPKRASATEVNSSGYGWFYDTTTKLLTVRLDDPTPHGVNATERELWFNNNIAPLLKPIYTPAANPFIRAYSNHIYFKNCKFEGIYLWALKHAANSKSSIYLEDCELKYSPSSGLIVDDSDYVLKDTYITRSQGDNIGVHEQTAGTVPEGIEINVKSTYAGDIDTYGTTIVENRNASSVHENCNVIRIGGEYAYSFGPNVIDVGVDVNSVGVSYNLNVKAHTSLATISNTDFETYNFRKVYLSNCKALYNGKIAVRTNAEIIYHNLIYNHLFFETGGLFTKYQF